MCSFDLYFSNAYKYCMLAKRAFLLLTWNRNSAIWSDRGHSILKISLSSGIRRDFQLSQSVWHQRPTQPASVAATPTLRGGCTGQDPPAGGPNVQSNQTLTSHGRNGPGGVQPWHSQVASRTWGLFRWAKGHERTNRSWTLTVWVRIGLACVPGGQAPTVLSYFVTLPWFTEWGWLHTHLGQIKPFHFFLSPRYDV